MSGRGDQEAQAEQGDEGEYPGVSRALEGAGGRAQARKGSDGL